MQTKAVHHLKIDACDFIVEALQKLSSSCGSASDLIMQQLLVLVGRIELIPFPDWPLPPAAEFSFYLDPGGAI